MASKQNLVMVWQEVIVPLLALKVTYDDGNTVTIQETCIKTIPILGQQVYYILQPSLRLITDDSSVLCNIECVPSMGKQPRIVSSRPKRHSYNNAQPCNLTYTGKG